jgi:sodium/hydrogen exchanger 10/11
VYYVIDYYIHDTKSQPTILFLLTHRRNPSPPPTRSASPRSIEGESLFNDGTALVIFLIVVGMVDGSDTSSGAVDYISKFIVMSFGGMIWGTVFGFIIVTWLGVIFNDAMSEITITMSSAYLCFYLAERVLGVSGVIAVVCYGLYFGSIGRTRVSPEVAHFLEEFWELLAFFGNTLIFVIAGIVIGRDVDGDLLTGSNVGKLFLIYVGCSIVRGFVIGLVYSFLSKCGVPLQKEDQVIAWWGGLRGAVGLALAMMVFANDCVPKEIRDYTLFYTSGIVILTVCVNSLSMPNLVSFMEMDRVAPSRQMVFDQAMRNLRAAGDKQEAILRSDHVFDSAVWDVVRSYYFEVPKAKQAIEQGVKNTSDKQKLEAKEARRRVLMICKKSYWKQFQDGLLGNHAVKYLMHHTDIAIDNECEINEWDTFSTLLKFNSSINNERREEQGTELDAKSKKRRTLLKMLDSVLTICAILVLVIVACVWSIFTEDTDNKEMTAYRVFEYVSTFIFTVELTVRLYCLGDFHSFIADPYTVVDSLVVVLDLLLLLAGDVLGSAGSFTKGLRVIRFVRLIRLVRFARLAKKIQDTNLEAVSDTKSLWDKSEGVAKNYKRRILYNQLQHGYDVASGFKIAREEALDLLSGLLGSATRFQAIRDEIEEDLKSVRSSLLDMQRLYSEIASSITTGIAARTVLNKQRHAIHDLFHEGMLDKSEMDKMIGSVEYQMKRLQYQPPVISMPAKEDLLKQIPWLECLSMDQLSGAVDSFEDSVFTRGDVLLKQDDMDDTVYVLARGTVVVELETQLGEKIELDELGMGSVFGEISWALKSSRGASIIATSPGLLFKIAGSKLTQLANQNPDLSDRLWDTCGRRLSENMIAGQIENHNKSRRQIRDIVHNMDLFTVKEKRAVEFKAKAHVILLIGTGVQMNKLTGAVDMIESPAIIEAMEPGVDYYSVSFSSESKFMCELSCVARKAHGGKSNSPMLIDSSKGKVEGTIDKLLEDKGSPDKPKADILHRYTNENLAADVDAMNNLLVGGDFDRGHSRINRNQTLQSKQRGAFGADIDKIMKKSARGGRLTQEEALKTSFILRGGSTVKLEGDIDVDEMIAVGNSPNGAKERLNVTADDEEDDLEGLEGLSVSGLGALNGSRNKKTQGKGEEGNGEVEFVPFKRKNSMISSKRYKEPSSVKYRK